MVLNRQAWSSYPQDLLGNAGASAKLKQRQRCFWVVTVLKFVLLMQYLQCYVHQPGNPSRTCVRRKAHSKGEVQYPGYFR